ncbi:MAG: hypothetical protein A2519_14910 [Candidatus Raymondbacteria bacterium RIFOXYD12_FULL_49_13]|uniref:DNA polymerase helix-hairpin-helix motif domain-containing protein n=1 Tax=Candidatus Raymondbacteria bacterium RIFOXYD12_FULL_49_13 TaxID=1817890 RepID=A0A1F7F485_UNCRA|nr:MAG: hypothetical protein A2519_14910 [Candidatus Raymondbacteria bacterium RIFOXYD12_FULL_49_13]
MRTNPAVCRLIANGLTRGIFYIESPAQIKLNRKAMAGTFEEIGITSSAVRPAGAASTKTFVERHRKLKQGVVDWEYLHPSLRPLLSETHDCLIYQEDVIKVCHEVAGLNFKQADRVRKIMNSMHYGKPHDYDAVACEFLNGCAEHSGLTQTQAMELWERVCSFSGFSFCKSHSLSYAQLSFKCAYLKAHFPAQFLAAVVSNNHGFYATSVYLNEARCFGIRIQQLDINKSDASYVGRGQFMIPGLMHIKGLGHATIHQCVEERATQGRYANLIDFLLRTRAGLKETEILIKTGCFDGFNMNHPELLSLLHAEYGKIRRDSSGLFDYAQNFRDEFHPGLADYSFTQRCLNELEILGFMLSGNILSILDLHPASKTAVPAADICRYAGRRVKLLGWPITARPHHIPDRGEMKFITVEDNSGCADIVLWPEAYTKYAHVTHGPGPYEIFGRVKEEWDTYSVFVEKMSAVTWSPVQIDFERAAGRLRDSYRSFAREPIVRPTVVAA